jgi:anti-sigma factor RsiW
LSRPKASADDRLAEWVVAGHVRSLQVNHLTDVPSGDQHTVKPWFRGKLDFSPQVRDLSAQGYTLSGGRLDYLADRQVAALVFHRRQHVINLFTWPGVDGADSAVRSLARQGFNIRRWQESGMTYWAISDLNDQELDEFVRLYHVQSPEPRQ